MRSASSSPRGGLDERVYYCEGGGRPQGHWLSLCSLGGRGARASGRAEARPHARALRGSRLDVHTELPIVCVQRSRLDVHTELAIICVRGSPVLLLDLHFMIINLCIKFESNTLIFSKDIDRKPFFKVEKGP